MSKWVWSRFLGSSAALLWFSFAWYCSQVVKNAHKSFKTGKGYSLEANIFLRCISLFCVEAEP